MPQRNIPAFVAYEANGGGTNVPLIAKGAPGTAYLASSDGTRSSTSVAATRPSDGAPVSLASNIHGVVESFRVNAPETSPGIYFVSGPMVTEMQRFVEGSRGRPGLPGVSAVPADEAVAAYLDGEGTSTRASARAVVAAALDDTLDARTASLLSAPSSTTVDRIKTLSAAVLADSPVSTYRPGPQNAIAGFGAAEYTPGDKVSGTAPSGGYEITAFGAGALQENQRGWKNVAVGSYAGRDNIDGYYNVFVGNSAGERNIGGVGDAPKNANDPGARNTYLGSNAGRYSTTGRGNVAIGRNASHSNISGKYTTAVGTNAYSGVVSGREEDGTLVHSEKSADYVTAVGWGAAFFTDAPQSTAVGCRALYQSSLPASYGGTAVGHYALEKSEGRENTALGNEAGTSVTTGRFNTAIGARPMSGSAGVTGSANTAIGTTALFEVTSGSYNTAIGQEALSALKTGSSNTVVGHQASKTTPAGVERTTALGFQSGATHSNSVALGAGTDTTNVDQATIGPRALALEARSATPSAPPSGATLWVEKSGSKNVLKCRFPTGGTFTLATES